MVTDPPYGVDYDPSWRTRAGVNLNPHKLGAVANDDRADWTEAWKLFRGDVVYVWHAGLKASTVQASLEHAGFAMRAQIILPRIASPCPAVTITGSTNRVGTRYGRTPRDIAPTTDRRARSGRFRPATMTATATAPRSPSSACAGRCRTMSRRTSTTRLPDRARPSSPPNNSGRCYAIEIEPTYVQMAIDRCEAFTGRTAVPV
jgi:hypothetical protein